MSWFQLDAPSIAHRVRQAGHPVKVPSLAKSLLIGMLGFTLVSVAGFVPWAVFGGVLHQAVGEAGLYAVCALVFIALSGLLLHRLIIGPGSLSRFYQLFSVAFLAYAIAWIVGWMALRGHPGSVVGLLAGTAFMGFILAIAFEAYGETFKVVAALFLLNSAGYFLGGIFEGCLLPVQPFILLDHPVTRPTLIMLAKLQWGVCYGLGFGAGLGLAFYLCQKQARALLAQR